MPKPRPPDASVKSARSGDLDQKGSGIIAWPFQTKILQPPSDIPANFSIEGYMMVG